MSYLEKLIERATDSSLNLENNKIGNYIISCQHGCWVFIYNIYKNEEHLFSLSITNTTLVIEYNKNECSSKELKSVKYIIGKLYMNTKKISIQKFN